MDSLSVVGSVLSLIDISIQIMVIARHLRDRLEAEHKNDCRSPKELSDALSIALTRISKYNGRISKDVGGNVDLNNNRATKESPQTVVSREEWETLRGKSIGTAEDKWYTMWSALFPSLDFPQIPGPPFYDFGDSPRSIFDEAEPIKSGAYSQVSRVRIHLDSIHGYGGDEIGRLTFAVKRFNSGNYQQYAWEQDALQRLFLAQNPHPHIVPLLASYRAESKYHLIFPSANCDLAMFWRNQPRPSNDKRTLEWFGGQMRGLLHALDTLHRKIGQGRHLVHGDIKPANILCFSPDGSEKWPVFALTDFGSSYFLTPEEKGIPKGLKHTPVYRAPELDTSIDGITVAYDIWSFGCVLAEAIAWFYDGKAGIAKLNRARLDEEDSNPNRDAFFWLKRDKRGGLTAKVKPEVQRLLISLRENSQSSLFIDDMLYLVLEGMLKVNISERMSAREVLNALTQMCMKLETDSAYSEPRGSCDVEMVPIQNASRQRLDQTVDANYYTNTTTQSLSDAGTQGTNLTTQSDAGTQELPKPLFACPFYAAGVRISGRRACEGRGFADVNKTKEHLIRRHLVKEYKGKHICRRCYTGFSTDELLQTHAHQEPPCSAKTPETVINKLSGEQAFQLRSLKRKSSKESAEDRWFDICRILFPSLNGNLKNISPYQEANSTSVSMSSSTDSNRFYQYRDHLRNRSAEQYAAEIGYGVTPEVAARILELEVREFENFERFGQTQFLA